MKKEYKNYIFDLYGTLIDISTDEDSPVLWEKMAAKLQNDYSAKISTSKLRTDYLKYCREAEEELKKKNHAEFPEIQIEYVWERLINENSNAKVKAGDLEPLCVYFRETSRDKFGLYKGVLDTFSLLKKRGKKIYLLSNAQRMFTEKELKDTLIDEEFDDIFISSDKLIKKPQKEFLDMLIAKHGLNRDECVMIGNEIRCDVAIAVNCGISSIFLNTNDHTDEAIKEQIDALGIKDKALLPKIINDGDITKIID